MKNINIRNIKTLFINELKIKQKSIIIFLLAITGITNLYMLLYPSVKEIFIDKLEAMPSELLELFGISGAMPFTNYNMYFGSIAGILALVSAIYLLIFAVNIFMKEEEDKTIEYTYANSVSRSELWISKVLTIKVILILLFIIIFVSGTVAGLIVASDELNVLVMLGSSFFALIISFFFVGASLLLSSINMKFKPLSLGFALLFSLYLLGYLGSIAGDSVAFLKYLSPFAALSISDFSVSVVSNTASNYWPLLIFTLISVVATISAYFLYLRKDFK